MNALRQPPVVDLDALAADLDALRERLNESAGAADVAHLKKVALVGRLCSAVGWATAWLPPNPVSVLALSTGNFIRWTTVAHHVLHKGYDDVEGAPKRFTSQVFARGWRRWIDWPDWIDPAAWDHEHNGLHHYRTGEEADPDQPERNLNLLRRTRLPMPARYAFLAGAAMLWKPLYYSPNTIRELDNRRERRKSGRFTRFPHPDMFLPWREPGATVWKKSWLPYMGLHFGLAPLPFLLLGPHAYVFALVNRGLAELLTNLHSWVIIVPNHAGEDVWRFDDRMTSKGDFYYRQVVGTANYATGGFFNDLMHGWLNYQIEHHVFPDLTMRQYVLAQPEVKAICEKHGLPYVQESIVTRVRKLVRVLVGKDSMPRCTTKGSPRASDPSNAPFAAAAE